MRKTASVFAITLACVVFLTLPPVQAGAQAPSLCETSQANANATAVDSGFFPSASTNSLDVSDSKTLLAKKNGRNSCPYSGDWSILLAITDNGDMSKISGSAQVTNQSMTLKVDAGGQSGTFKGAFAQVSNDTWLYQVDNRTFVGIGKNKQVGATVVVMSQVGDTPSQDSYIAMIAEPTDGHVKGCEPFVGSWKGENGAQIDITEAGTLIGEDKDGIWYNFYEVKNGTMKLKGLPDCFVPEGDRLRYELNGATIYLDRIG